MSRCPEANMDGRPCVRTRNHNGLHLSPPLRIADREMVARWGSWSRVDEDTNGIGTKRAQRMARKRRRGVGMIRHIAVDLDGTVVRMRG